MTAVRPFGPADRIRYFDCSLHRAVVPPNLARIRKLGQRRFGGHDALGKAVCPGEGGPESGREEREGVMP